jgi:hypothetical protein
MHARFSYPYSPSLSLSLFFFSYCEADVSPEFVRIHVAHDHADKAAALTAGTDHTVQIERAKVKISASIQIENELENKKSKSGDGDSARFAQALRFPFSAKFWCEPKLEISLGNTQLVCQV